jgi:glycosyltransferase involved in cell wall biosynthesis
MLTAFQAEATQLASDKAMGVDVVVITPVAARRDSRVLKQGLSVARAGFRSILFEGRCSVPPTILPGVEIVGMSGATKQSAPSGTRRDNLRGLVGALRKRVTSPNATWVEAWIGFLAYLISFVHHFVVGGLRYLPPASLYYLNEFSFFPAVWVKSRLYGAAIAYDARDFYVGIETDENKTPFQKLVARFGRMIEKRCIQRANVFTTIGEGIAALFEREYGRRPETIHNVHDDRIDQTPSCSLRERASLPTSATVVVIVGQAKSGQDFSGVLRALERLPGLNVATIGNGYRELLCAATRSKAIENRLHFIENVPANEVVPLIRDADAALLVYYQRSANYKNSLPNGFFQAVAAGLPVLHSGLPEVTRLANKFGFGVGVAPDDAERMTELLRHVLDRSAWYENLKRQSLQAAQELTWQKQEIRLQRLLIWALQSRHASEG